jgi:putative heme-binding domain-containing protein
MPELIKTTHVAFRPIDAKLGPDGAIYIADWYNPIIQHGEVDFRDPRRDHVHGRIWRVTAKGRDLAPRPKLVGSSVEQLVAQLASPEPFVRTQAKRVLAEGAAKVLPALVQWLARLDPQDPDYDHLRLEVLWTQQSVDHVELGLLKALLRSPDHRVRAAATRVLYHWWPRVPEALPLLAVQIDDDHPRVRLEAVNALAQMRSLEAAGILARALDRPLDEYLDFALWRALRSLEDVWLPAVQAGRFDFDGHPQRLLFALQAMGSPGVVGPLLALVREGKIPAEREDAVLALVGTLGGPDELGFVFEAAADAKAPAPRRARLLAALGAAARARQAKPAGDLAARLGPLVSGADAAIAAEAARLVGLWKLAELRPALAAAIESRDGAPEVKLAAIEALSDLRSAHDRALLDVVAASEASSPALRQAAVAALARFDPRLAATRAAALLASPAVQPEPIVQAFLERKDGPAALAAALSGAKLSPDVARLAVRAVRSSAREEATLVEALSRAGGLDGGPVALSPEELGRLAQDVAAQGDPARGELVFRRADLTCLKCHAIGGAGGQVGPDLSSIGASAQVDYLIESLLEPGKKIKENYHSLVVVTDEGRVVTGVKVRETPDALILRDAEDREAIPLASIDEQNDGGSLMPAGLIDTLTREELVDLVRFLSQLGKVGQADTPFAVGKAAVVRRWEALSGGPEALGRLMTSGPEGLTWVPIYSRVSGALPLADAPQVATPRGDGVHVLRFELEAVAAGAVNLVFDNVANVQLWANGQRLELAATTALEVSAGRTTCYVVVPAALREALRVELAEAPGSPAQARIVGGK